jgi:hypothetical protein
MTDVIQLDFGVKPDISNLAVLPNEWVSGAFSSFSGGDGNTEVKLGGGKDRGSGGDKDRNPATELDQPANIERAREWCRNDAPIAVENQGGDGRTFNNACYIIDNFALSEGTTLAVMAEDWNKRCQPPWTLPGLATKVRNAWRYMQKRPGATAAEEEAVFGNLKDRPKILIQKGALHLTMAKTQRVLLEQADQYLNQNGGSTIPDQIFQRGGELVRLSRNLLQKTRANGTTVDETQTVEGVAVDAQYREKNALTIAVIRPPWLCTRLTRAINYGVVTDEGFKPVDVPMRLVNQIIGDSTQWEYPQLGGTIEAPTLRADGSVLDVPGYDPASGLHFDPGSINFPKIAPNPTKEEGVKAMKYLDVELLSSFPFQDQEGYEGVSKSVAMALMLTAVTRRSFPIAPAFAADSNEPESGKTMLLKAGGALMTGREIAGRPFSASEEERRKSIGTALYEGRPMLLFDNADGTTIEGASLEMMLTMPLFEDRKLGSHEGISAPTNALTAFSCNHISVGGTGMTTRIYVSRVVPKKSLAERLTDGDFRHADLIRWIFENRPQLIAAVLTVLRAFIVHGKDKMPSTKSRFVEWGNLIGNALIWYGYADPVLGCEGIKAEDPVKEAMAEVVRLWFDNFRRKPVRAADLAGCPEICAVIAGAEGLLRVQDVSVQVASSYIKRMVGVRLGGVFGVEQVAQSSTRRYTKRWRLVQVIPDDQLPDIGL